MDLEKIVNETNATLVDVREAYEFEPVHAKGAINIPLGMVRERLEDFQKMSKPIVLYCVSGNRSGQAMNYLKEQGIEEVYNGGGVFQVLGMQEAIYSGK